MHDSVLQRCAIETAVEVARGLSDYSELLETFVRRLGAAAGSGWVTWSFREGDATASMQVSGCSPPPRSLLAQANRQDLRHTPASHDWQTSPPFG